MIGLEIILHALVAIACIVVGIVNFSDNHELATVGFGSGSALMYQTRKMLENG